jgi:pimeloyl-ACP methyl ester carboxylesterase
MVVVGLDLVLIHGSYGRAESWDPVLAGVQLPDDTRVAKPTLPGWGSRRGEGPVPLSLAELTHDIEAQVEEPRGPIALVGYSIGATLALELAIRQAWPLASLTLIEPNCIPILALTRFESEATEHTAASAAFVAASDAGDPHAAKLAVSYLYGPDHWQQLPEGVQQHLSRYARTMARDSAATAARSYDTTEFTHVTVPSFIASGAASPATLRHVAQALADFLPQASLVDVEGADHGMIDTHPSDIARTLQEGPLEAL